MLPYFLRAEGYARPVSGLHGDAGPLRVESLRDPNETTHAFLRAAAEVGIPTIDDVNGPRQEGAALTRVNQRRGRRWSAADAYLHPAMRRKNLTVVTDVRATRIVLEGRRARGVEVVRGGRAERFACHELIVSSGAVNSPHLLLASGIGPADELRARGVEARHALPGVGRNLQDHLSYAVVAACARPVTLVAAESLANVLRYLVLRKGMLTSNVGEACAFVRSREGLAAPDLELIFAPAPFVGHGLTPQRDHALTVGVVLQQPRSRGAVTLTSADPLAAPTLRANYLSDPEGDDLQTMTRGVELARRVLAAPALAPYARAEVLPGAGASVERSIRERAETLYHPVGTCRMGTDDLAVVDPELRVRGLEGLRVADASVMPTIIRGHTHAPTVMIAEKAADLLRGRTLPRARAE